jgi:hypothetical protein
MQLDFTVKRLYLAISDGGITTLGYISIPAKANAACTIFCILYLLL